MTLDEFMRWDGRIPLDEYQRRLKTKKKLERSIGLVSDHMMWEQDAMEVLEGNERYQKHLEKYQRLSKKRDKLMSQLKELGV